MATETLDDALGTSMQAVLETMFFTMPDGELNPLGPPPVHHRVGMTFTGACWGNFELRITADSARAIAENFTGATDPVELREEQVREVLAELTNMICGSALSQWASDKIFRLGSPQWIETPDLATAKTVAEFRGSRAFDLGGGVLAAEIEVVGCQV